MKRRFLRFALLAAVLAAGCGDDNSGTPAPTSTPEPSEENRASDTPNEPPGENTATPTVPAPEYPTEGELATQIAAAAPFAINPAPQSVGALSLTATRCQYDGPAFVGSHYVIYEIATTSDGSVFVLDGESRLRRYAVEGGSACHLRMDRSFGDGGFFSTGRDGDWSLTTLSTDNQGHLVASTEQGGSYYFTGATMNYHCEASQGAVRLTEAGVGMASRSNQTQKITFGPSSCTVEPLAFEVGNLAPPDRDASSDIHTVGVVGDRVFLAGLSPTLAREFSVAGDPAGDAFGASDAEGRFCAIGNFFKTSAGFGVTDSNCKELRFFANDRSTIGSVSIHSLIGFASLAYPTGMSNARGGAAYLAVKPDYDTRPYTEGYIFRINGL